MHTVLMAAQKGGAGKSTLAAHFGALAERDGRTLLIDADPQGSLAFWYDRRASETPLLVKATANEIEGTLADARSEGIAWTIIDSPPHNAPLIGSLMSRATVTVIPVRPGPFDLAAAGSTLDMARKLKAPIAFILNACPPITRESETVITAEARALRRGGGAQRRDPAGHDAGRALGLTALADAGHPYGPAMVAGDPGREVRAGRDRVHPRGRQEARRRDRPRRHPGARERGRRAGDRGFEVGDPGPDRGRPRDGDRGRHVPRAFERRKAGRLAEPVVTHADYSRPQFTDAAPRPLDPPPTVEAQASAGPESLARFIARNGGIRLDGEATATDLHRFNIPGLGNVARPNGKGIDNFWRERLIEEGFFRPDADGGMARDITNDLLRRLQNEQRGVPSYPVGQERAGAAGRTKSGQVQDEYRHALSEAEGRLDADLTKAGVDPETLHPDVRSRTLSAMMRGEETDPLRAYERTVSGMKDPPAPFSRSTAVEETIPDVQFGQANPQPVVDHIDRLLETAKGPAAKALSDARKTLFARGGRDLDLSVEGLHNSRDAINDLIGKAEPSAQRVLMGVRDRLDRALTTVPEYEHARSGFEAASRKGMTPPAAFGSPTSHQFLTLSVPIQESDRASFSLERLQSSAGKPRGLVGAVAVLSDSSYWHDDIRQRRL